MSSEEKKYWTDDDAIIEKYVRGKLSYEEKLRLDEEISDCEPCKQKLRHELEMAAGIRLAAQQELKLRLQKNLRRERINQNQYYTWISMAAAVVIIFIGIGVYKIFLDDLTAPHKFQNREIVLTQKETDESKSDETVKEEKKSAAKDEKTEREKKQKLITEMKDISQKERPLSENIALAEQSISESKPDETEVLPPSKAQTNNGIWLIGKVIVKNEPMMSTQTAAGSETAAARMKNESSGAAASTAEQNIAKTKKIQFNIQFQILHRSISEIPVEQRSSIAQNRNEIAALLEKNENGFTLTLFGDEFLQDELQSAQVETASDDSLVVVLPLQRIAYKLPSPLQQINSPASRHR